jgi:hypothetical protein
MVPPRSARRQHGDAVSIDILSLIRHRRTSKEGAAESNPLASARSLSAAWEVTSGLKTNGVPQGGEISWDS